MYYYYSHFTERLRRSWNSETEKPGPKSGSLTWCPPDSHGSALKGPRASVTSAEGLFRILVDYRNKLPREGDLRNWRWSWRNSRCPSVCICCWRMLIPTAYRPECRTASFPNLPTFSLLLQAKTLNQDHKEMTTAPRTACQGKSHLPDSRIRKGDSSALCISCFLHQMLLFRWSNICHPELKQLKTNSFWEHFFLCMSFCLCTECIV